MGSGLNFFTNAIDVSPTQTGQWVDVDVGWRIPEGATGVVIDAIATAEAHSFVRKKGSTDERTTYGKIFDRGHCYLLCGVDASRVFQAYITSTDIKLWLVGYSDEKVSFPTNAVNYTPATYDAWVDVDLSPDVPSGATGAIFEMMNKAAGPRKAALRKNGSTDDRYANSEIEEVGHIYGLTGVDGGRILEAKIESADIELWLVGYTKSPVTFFTNATDKSIATTEAWTDIDLTGDTESSADGAIFEVHNTAPTNKKGLVRKNGSTDDRKAYGDVKSHGHICALCGLDEGNVFEGYIEVVDVDFYLLGYCKPVTVRSAAEARDPMRYKTVTEEKEGMIDRTPAEAEERMVYKTAAEAEEIY